jgi:serine/threonine-protein kinase
VKVGEVFAERYQLREVLGSGGTGSVWRATDSVLGRDVAIKVLRVGGVDEEAQRARMQAEARLAGALSDPAIAPVYDYGETDEAPYIVMAFVEGETLSARLRGDGPLPAARVMEIVGQVAGGLEVAHRAGIVHRDLKPANVMVRPDGTVVLVDFGIARSQGADPLTATGTVVGTVDYLSPEQANGQSATPRSDLYSLGMMAYECLSGLRPFHKETMVATALAHVKDDAPPLPDDVPADVRRLVEEMIAKDPERRPASAGEVAARATALAARAAGVPAAAVPYLESTVVMRGPVVAAAAATARTRRETWRKRSLWMVGPAVVLALVLAWAVRAVGDEPAAPADRDQQVQPRDRQPPSDTGSPTPGGGPRRATKDARPAGSGTGDGGVTSARRGAVGGAPGKPGQAAGKPSGRGPGGSTSGGNGGGEPGGSGGPSSSGKASGKVSGKASGKASGKTAGKAPGKGR